MKKNKAQVFNPTLGKETDKKIEQKPTTENPFIKGVTEFKMLDSLNEKQKTEVKISILKPNFLQKVLKKDKKKYFVYPLTMAQSVEVAKRLLLIPNIDLKGLDEYQALNESIKNATKENVINLCEIISLFLEGQIKEKTVKFLYENLSFSEVSNFVLNIIVNAGFVDFTTTTFLIQNTQQLKTVAK